MILVIGATGKLGGAITQLLLAQRKKVQILVRPQSNAEYLARKGLATSATDLIHKGAQPVYGDLKDRLSLEWACEGIDTVITTANSVMRHGDDNVTTVDKEGNHRLIDVARLAGVKQFIFISALMASEQSPHPFLQAKSQTERYLREHGPAYTIVAPNAFMESWPMRVVGLPAVRGQAVKVIGSGERKHSFISLDDVARFTVACVDNPRALNQRFVLGGPEAMSFRDAAAVVSQVLGHEVAVQSVAPGEPVPTLPEGMWPLLAGFDQNDTLVDMSQLIRTFGLRLTCWQEVARR
ncbi:MAG: NmrA family NAD(P)-binding protein, partial [Chloroflexi bacterium]|nr:NmrA family NAD(P)-binding protein [Chloroflexota bacterium]